MIYKFNFSLLIIIMITGISSGQIWSPDHVVIVIEENHTYNQIAGSTAAPYINGLLRDSKSAIFSESYALMHPSQPNYIMFFSGANQGVTDDYMPLINPFNTSNLGSSLIKAGFTFIGYSEDLPSVGYNGITSGNYVRKHNPWSNWQGSINYPIPLASSQPFSAFPSDYTKLPTVSIVIPNLNNDMHNGYDPVTISTGDAWLKNHLDGYIQWAKTHNSLFILTFDEDNDVSGNRILTFFTGSMVKQGTYTQTNNHYNFLRMLEDMYSLPYSGASSTTATIDYCWKSALPVELASFTSAIAGREVILKWETKTEKNLAKFIIERSTDNKEFQICGEIRGHGNRLTSSYYSFSDNKIEPGDYFYRLKMVDLNGTYMYSNLTEVKVDIPRVWSLSQNYPNPFNPSTTIAYSLPEASNVKLSIYNSLGQVVKIVENTYKTAGNYQTTISSDNLNSGIFFYKIEAGKYSQIKKMIIIK